MNFNLRHYIEGKILRVRMIMKEGVKDFDAPYLFDEGSTISWIPCGRKLTCSYPGRVVQAIPVRHCRAPPATAPPSRPHLIHLPRTLGATGC